MRRNTARSKAASVSLIVMASDKRDCAIAATCNIHIRSNPRRLKFTSGK